MSLLLVAWTGILIALLRRRRQVPRRAGAADARPDPLLPRRHPAPQLPLLWHPLLLLNHVTILSLVAYHWEEKRPPLTKSHWWGVLGGLATVNVLSARSCIPANSPGHGTVDRRAPHRARLLIPLACVVAFVAIGWSIRRIDTQLPRCGVRS
jgi:hypothetical protein